MVFHLSAFASLMSQQGWLSNCFLNNAYTRRERRVRRRVGCLSYVYQTLSAGCLAWITELSTGCLAWITELSTGCLAWKHKRSSASQGAKQHNRTNLRVIPMLRPRNDDARLHALLVPHNTGMIPRSDHEVVRTHSPCALWRTRQKRAEARVRSVRTKVPPTQRGDPTDERYDCRVATPTAAQTIAADG